MPRSQLTQHEWRIMNVVWDRAPVSAREVLEAIVDETGWVYSTVKTYLTRLKDKGLLEEQITGKTAFYSPLIAREQARQSALRSLVDRAFDGTFSPLVQCLFSERMLTAEERDALRAWLDEEDRREDGAGGERDR